MAVNHGVKVYGDVRDRGKQKWISIMPTELVEELRKWKETDDKAVRPVHDEYDLQTLQDEVSRAISSGLETRISTWVDGGIRYHRGVIREVSTQYLSYENTDGRHRVAIHEIVAVMITE